MDIDLNLLRTFDVLMELRSVTRTARQLGVTQSAVSQALAKLRNALEDPLFTRTPRGLQPTARAVELAPRVRTALHKIRDALEPSTFDEARSQRLFTVAAGSYFSSLIVPPLFQQVHRRAPGVTLRIIPVSELLIEGLDFGTIDLALGAFPSVPDRMDVEALFDETMVWIAAASSRHAAAPFDAKQIATLPRVRITIVFEAPEYSADHNKIYSSVEPIFREGTVYDAHTAVSVIAASDLVGLAPRRLALHHADSVVILGPDEEDHMLSLSMLWHSRLRADPGLIWLRNLILEISRN